MREMAEMGKGSTDEMEKRQLLWFGHNNRTEETRCSGRVQKWVPQERGEGGRQRRGWTEDRNEAVDARDLAEGESGDGGRRNCDSCTIISRYAPTAAVSPVKFCASGTCRF
jgi:hypothetical protein